MKGSLGLYVYYGIKKIKIAIVRDVFILEIILGVVDD